MGWVGVVLCCVGFWFLIFFWVQSRTILCVLGLLCNFQRQCVCKKVIVDEWYLIFRPNVNSFWAIFIISGLTFMSYWIILGHDSDPDLLLRRQLLTAIFWGCTWSFLFLMQREYLYLVMIMWKLIKKIYVCFEWQV